MTRQPPVVIGMTGATGIAYGIRLLTMLKELAVPVHAVMTRSATLTMRLETNQTPEDVARLAGEVYSIGDVGAAISSGSYRTAGMIVAPCSIKTLSGIVNCYEDNLLLRAAGVTLKERRRLLLLVRETPLHKGQLRLLLQAAEMDITIFPPVPAFYTMPETIDDLIDQTCARALDQFGFDAPAKRWKGTSHHLQTDGREVPDELD